MWLYFLTITPTRYLLLNRHFPIRQLNIVSCICLYVYSMFYVCKARKLNFPLYFQSLESEYINFILIRY